LAAALDAREPWLERAASLRSLAEDRLGAAGAEVVGAEFPRIPPSAPYTHAGVSSEAQLIQFDMAGIAVSAGSACWSGTMKVATS
jgi:cysteine desulfurase